MSLAIRVVCIYTDLARVFKRGAYVIRDPGILASVQAQRMYVAFSKMIYIIEKRATVQLYNPTSSSKFRVVFRGSGKFYLDGEKGGLPIFPLIGCARAGPATTPKPPHIRAQY